MAAYFIYDATNISYWETSGALTGAATGAIGSGYEASPDRSFYISLTASSASAIVFIKSKLGSVAA